MPDKPPDSPDQDEILLGEILSGAKPFTVVAAMLYEFPKPEHARIFRTMAELHRRDEPINRLTVANELRKRGELAATGGLQYVAKLSEYGEGKK